MVWGKDMLNRLKMPGMWMLLAGLMYTTAYAQPVVNLGPDVFACGSAVLNAGNAGASFLWSTGESTQTITVTASGIYWVDVTDGSGTTRDSINATITSTPATPVVADTSVCGGAPFSWSSGSSADKVVWYTTPTGGDIRAIGSTINLTTNASVTLYPLAVNHAPIQKVGIATPGVLTPSIQTRGLIFDVFSPITIHSVLVFSNIQTTATIQLRNSSNTVLASTVVSVPGNLYQTNPVRVPIMFDVPVGTNYQLVAVLNGRLGFQNTSVAFPYTAPGLMSIKSAQDGSTSIYNYFYDWEVSPQVCRSARDAATATMLPTPVFNLGPSQEVVCGNSRLLDATSSGATYLWSNGSTVPTITATQSGPYTVVSTVGGCTARDSINLLILPPAVTPVVSDTTVCAASSFTLRATSPNNTTVWRESGSNRLLGTGDSLSLSVMGPTNVLVRGANLSPSLPVGMTTFQSLSYINQLRGLQFDVFEPMVIESVVLYANQASDVTIRLENASSQLITSHRVVLTGPANQPQRVPVYFEVQPGVNYRLMLQVNSGAVGIPSSVGVAYPYTVPGTMTITNSHNNVLVSYGYFFDWRIRRGSCFSATDTIRIQTLPSPVVNLGLDTLICGTGPLSFNAGQAGASYLWSTGSADSAISVSASGTYGVQVSLGICAASDQVEVTFIDEALTPQVADTAVCVGAPFTLRSLTPNPVTLWRNLATNQILGSVDSLTTSVQATTQFTAQGVSLSPLLPVGLASFQTLIFLNETRGLLFDATDDFILQSVVLYANQPSTGVIFLQNASLQTIASQTVSIAGGASLPFRIPLYFQVAKGQGYRLMLQTTSGLFGVPNSASISYPYLLPGVVSINNSANNVSASYGYLFDWRVSTGGCFSTADTISVSTLLSPLVNLGPDTLICGNDPLVLNVGQAGASYTWSTGSTDSTIQVVANGTYGVTVSIGVCSANDQLRVDFLPEALRPQTNDTTVCAGIPFFIKSPTANPVTVWRNQNNGQIIGVGDSTRFTVQDSARLLVQGLSLAPSQAVGMSSFQALIYLNETRGLLFNATEDFILESVILYASQPATGVVFLQNSNLQTIASQQVSIPGVLNQPYRIPLYFRIPKGQNYRLMLQITSGVFAVPNSASISYPYVLPGLVSINNSANNVSASYGYFFDWRVSTGGCFSDVDTVKIATLPSPVVNLGRDTLVCGTGPLLLNVSQAGATYLWNDGSTQGNLAVLNNDTLSVKVNLGVCQLADTIVVDFLPEAIAPSVNDTVVCEGRGVMLSSSFQADELVWYLSDTGNNVIGTGPVLNVDLPDTALVYAQTINSGPTVDAGRVSPGFLSFSSQSRGFRFDALSDITIQYVTVYTNVPSDFRVVLRNGQNQVLAFRDVSTSTSGGQATLIPLYFDVPRGSNYRLVAENVVGSIGFSSGGNTYPYRISGLISINTDELSNVLNYNYFYKVVVSKGVCRSERTSFQVAVKYPIMFDRDIYSCDPVQVTATSNPNASYLWSTGATTNTVTLDTSGVYSVMISDPDGCMVLDTLKLDIPVDAGLPDDGILCGQVLKTNYDQGATFLWSTGETTSTIAISAPGEYFVRVNEPRGCTLLDTIQVTGFDTFPVVNLGQDFSQCDSATLNAGNPGLSFLWSSGDTTQTVTVVSSGTFIATVTNTNGCATSDTVLVFIPQRPGAEFFVEDTVISPNLSVSFLNLSSFGLFFWEFGDGSTSTGFNPAHTYQAPGTYCARLIVSDQINGCGSDTAEFCFTLIRYPVGLDDIALPGWKAYPVPASSYLMVEAETPQPEGAVVTLWTIQGKMVKRQAIEGGVTRVERGTLAEGVYLLRIERDGQLLGRKLIEFR